MARADVQAKRERQSRLWVRINAKDDNAQHWESQMALGKAYKFLLFKTLITKHLTISISSGLLAATNKVMLAIASLLNRI